MKIKDIPSNRTGVYVWRYRASTMIAFVNAGDTAGDAKRLFALAVRDDGRVQKSGWSWYKDGSADCDLEAEEINANDLTIEPRT